MSTPFVRLKFVGPDAELLKNLLEEEYGVRDLSAPAIDEWGGTEPARAGVPGRVPQNPPQRTSF